MQQDLYQHAAWFVGIQYKTYTNQNSEIISETIIYISLAVLDAQILDRWAIQTTQQDYTTMLLDL